MTLRETTCRFIKIGSVKASSHQNGYLRFTNRMFSRFHSISLEKVQFFVSTHRKSANELEWASLSRAFIVSSDVSFSATLIRPLEPFFTLDYNLLRGRSKENLSDFSHFAFHSQSKCFIVSGPPKQLGQSANELWRGARRRVINERIEKVSSLFIVSQMVID